MVIFCTKCDLSAGREWCEKGADERVAARNAETNGELADHPRDFAGSDRPVADAQFYDQRTLRAVSVKLSPRRFA